MNMALIYFFTTVLLACGTCGSPDGYVIRGNFPGLQDGMIVTLRNVEGEKSKVLARDTVSNGAFVLQGFTPSPVFCEIEISNKDLVKTKEERETKDICLFLDNSQMTVEAEHYDSLSYVHPHIPTVAEGRGRVVGGALQAEFNDYRERLLPLEVAAYVLEDSLLELSFYAWKYKPKEYKAQYRRLFWEHALAQEKVDAARLEFVRQHPDTPLSLYVIGQLLASDFTRTCAEVDELAGIAAQVEDSVRRPQLDKVVKRAKRLYKGIVYPDLHAKTPAGEMTTLSEHLPSGTYIVLDFWASWCGPCRAAIPGIKELYDEYGREDLNVVSLSVDEKGKNWQKAVQEEGMPWTQLWLEGDKQVFAACQAYNFQSIPRLVLLDREGRVIFTTCSADDLRCKLEDLLKIKR